MTKDQEFAEMIVKRLEEGTAPWQKGWSINEALCKPFHNAISGKAYKGANVVRCWIACDTNGYVDHRFMTYRQAAEKGYQVRKGEHGTFISFFAPVTKEEKDENGELVIKTSYAARGYTVFNAEQIDGIPAIPAAETFEWNPVELGERILTNSGAVIEHSTAADGCSYIPSSDKIVLPPKEQFKSAAEYYMAATHELAHWTGAEKRLDRKLSTSFGTEEYSREELRAEIASWMISTETGLPFDPDNHAAYVAAWIKAIRKDYREIFRACSDAEKIKDYILAFVKEEEKAA